MSCESWEDLSKPAVIGQKDYKECGDLDLNDEL